MSSPRNDHSSRDSFADQGTSSAGLFGLPGQTAGIDLNAGSQIGRSSLDVDAGSRRPSATSSNSMSPRPNRPPLSSPTSVSSSSTNHWATPRETLESGSWSNSPQSGPVPLPSPQPSTSTPSATAKYNNLPRIATPSQDASTPTGSPTDAEGARSATAGNSPLSGHPYPYQQPTRSASTPEPRLSPITGQMPARSPTDPRPSTLASHSFTTGLHPDHHSTGSHLTTPRMTSGSTASIHDTPSGTRSDTPTSTTSSHGRPAIATVQGQQGQTAQVPRRSGSVTYCAKCGLAVRGPFVRALHQVYHLDCFRCRDCDKVVAQKFFPVEDSEGQYPLCERDYFARLDLICAKCDQALRSSYITACGDKFHVEHFSCSVCDTVFGANDSYYEHDKKVYCHYHYSISFANKCVGCETAILKQFVEINRNGRDECWHPECYMIHKFWNVRLASRNFTTPAANTPAGSATSLLDTTAAGGLRPMSTTDTASARSSPGWGTELSAEELKERQISMELKVSQIWLVLSGFEESSAACIGEMLRVVQERKLLDVILLAEKFILHVETLFAVIDDLEAQFAMAGAKGMSHAREAKQLCRKLVNFFSMLSQISPTNNGAIPNMQELLNQVTQLAHYLKILIRIALTGAIKLDREQANPKAMTNALARLHLLSLDNADSAVSKRGDYPEPKGPLDPWTGNETPEEMAKRSFDSLTRHPQGFIPSTQQVAYGYRSLAVESTGETTLRGPQVDDFVPNDGCARCSGSIEDDCVRLGMFNRWHSGCVECKNCGDKASNTNQPELSPMIRESVDDDSFSHDGSAQHDTSVSRHQRRVPPRVSDFLYEAPPKQYGPAEIILCNAHRTPTAICGFQSVSRLEQFAFLLHVALRRLYLHFREHHHISSALTRTEAEGSGFKRSKSVTLDRKLSHTARVPQRSTVVESPAGKMADANGQVVTAAREPVAPIIMTPVDADTGEAPQVDVIRPPFARNNTSVRIVSETPEQPESLIPEADTLSPYKASPRRVKEEDALTLNNIPIITKNTPKSAMDSLPFMARLNNLQSLIVRHFALLHLQKTSVGKIIDMDDVLELLDARKNQWWNKLFKGNAKKEQKKKGIFGVPIELLVERTGSDSQQGASDAVLRVPEFIEEMISTMRQQDMAMEGIFRVNGNIGQQRRLVEALDRDYGSVTLSEESPKQLAALLKRFLRDMPDALLTFKLHKLFCAAATLPDAEERKRILHLLMVLLPRPNRDTAEVLFIFLRWVGSFAHRDEEKGSMMDLYNLALVIAPSILCARKDTKESVVHHSEVMAANQAIVEIFESMDDYFRVPSELVFVLQENVSKIFEKEVDLPPKEISKHCAKYLQARGQSQMLPQQQPRPSQAHAGPSTGPSQRTEVARDRDRDRDRDQREREMERQDRPSESRLSNYGNLSAPDSGAIRTSPSPNTGSRPTSWTGLPPGTGTSTPNSIPERPTPTLTMPTPQVNGATAGATSPTYAPPNSPWRGQFHGPGSNGSRQSSRGSAPSSPGIQDDMRRSFQMERDKSRERVWGERGG